MKLKFNKRSSTRIKSRMKNKVRIRRKVEGSTSQPRLAVFRSAKNIYAQLIDDSTGKTVASASSLKLKLSPGGNRESAKQVGAEIAKLAKSNGIESIVFDRSGYIYHGRIKALADGAREAGLSF